MDDLIRRAELAIGESRWIKSELHQSLAKARMAAAQVQGTMQLARAEVSVRDSREQGEGPHEVQHS